jgi:hypothetical protein
LICKNEITYNVKYKLNYIFICNKLSNLYHFMYSYYYYYMFGVFNTLITEGKDLLRRILFFLICIIYHIHII